MQCHAGREQPLLPIPGLNVDVKRRTRQSGLAVLDLAGSVVDHEG